MAQAPNEPVTIKTPLIKAPEDKAVSEEQAAVEKLSKTKPEEIAALLKKWLADE
ncbi:MAG TPA: hypothetical protein VN631_12505 [Negativicutes bacterium]|nr:hypothetical protein [Negativicutes bacterium]